MKNRSVVLTRALIERTEFNKTKETTPHVIWDRRARGLGVRISPRGNKAFFYRTRTLDGRSVMKTIGNCSVMSVKAAREIVLKIDREREEAKWKKKAAGFAWKDIG